MNEKQIRTLLAAGAAAVALGSLATVPAQAATNEKCFGIGYRRRKRFLPPAPALRAQELP